MKSRLFVKQVLPVNFSENYALFLSILVILISTGIAAQSTNSTVFSVRYSKILNRNFYIEIIMVLFYLHFFPVLLTIFFAAIIHHYKMEPMKNELKTKRKEIKEAIEKINEAVNGKPVMKNGIKDSLEEEFDCIEGPIGMDLEATTAEKITPKNSTPAAAASKMAPRKVPEISPVDYKYKNNGPIKFQTQNTRYFHISLQNFENPKLWINAKFQLEPDQKACKEVNIEKVKWDEGPIEFYETGLDVDKTEIHTPKVLSSSKLTASAK
ncbi:Protein CBG15300 [Caenorhabditis briggsae]|uniref:Protein CBG15300 n=1 Tax=Caenorhabditis briggsae TaxID=6238 RepID=A8XLW2_CAEBR|nr:Protein CBG15300 [Caenorhabditis briggsae]CAP33637.2 Protein CBG15300 [Caenorhabditis briggsae]